MPRASATAEAQTVGRRSINTLLNLLLLKSGTLYRSATILSVRLM